MSVEVLDGDPSGNGFDETPQVLSSANIDARRRVEDKIEEMRLRRETKEFDFDF